MADEKEAPQVVMEQGCTKDSWKDYDEGEYRDWIALFLKRSQHANTLGKKIADLDEGRNYLSMLIARLVELQVAQAKQAEAKAKAEEEKKEKEKPKK